MMSLITLQIFNNVTEGPGTASTSTYTGEILIMLLVAFILGYLLRYFLNSGLNKKIADLELALEKCNSSVKLEREKVYAAPIVSAPDTSEINKLKSDLAETNALLASMKAEPNNNATLEILNRDLNAKTTEVVFLKSEIASLKENLNACETEKNTLLAASLAPKHKDDLKKIEGIGPKIQDLCYNAGIYTFKELAETPVERIKEILTAAGDRYRIHDPATWPQQSALAAEGKWDELKTLQDQLNAGKA